MFFHVNPRDRSLAHADAGSAISGDEAAKELEQIWIMADHQHILAISVFSEELLEVGVRCAEIERCAYFDLAFISEFVANELRSLQGALQGAGNNDIRLDLESAEHAAHDHALLFTFCDKSPFRVELSALAGNSSIRMAHEVEIHNRQVGVSGRVKPLPSSLDFNILVTFVREYPIRQL